MAPADDSARGGAGARATDGAPRASAGRRHDVHLVDGTYELFRHFYALPSHPDAHGRDVGAVRGVLSSLLSLVREGATHVGVATDHVIESFRNDLWLGYKTGDGIDPTLRAQFEPLEEALAAMGIAVWPMVDLEADDALATAALIAAEDADIRRVFVCTPDKDLAQSVVGERVVQFDRRRRLVLDEAGITARFGVPPASIPDYLALVGDSADGYPGLPGWGARSSAAVLARFRRIDAIPDDAGLWGVDVRAAERLASVLAGNRERALLFRTLATLRTDADVGRPSDWRWRGPTPAFRAVAEALRAPDLARRAEEVASSLA